MKVGRWTLLVAAVVAVTTMAGPAWGQCVRACLDGDNLTYQIIDAEGEPFTRARIEENDYGWIFFYVFPESGWEFVVGGITAESDLMAEDGSITINFNTLYTDYPENGLEGVFPDDVDFDTMIFGAGLEGGDGDPDPDNVQVMSFDYSHGDLNFGEMLDFGAFGTDCDAPPYCEEPGPPPPTGGISGNHRPVVDEDVTLTLSLVNMEDPDPTYQWSKDGGELGGETGDELFLPAVQLDDTGEYSVVVTYVEEEGGDAAYAELELSTYVWVTEAGLPLAGGLGLGLLAGACALAGAVSIRRKK